MYSAWLPVIPPRVNDIGIALLAATGRRQPGVEVVAGQL
jgi:hypothetical protein